MRQTELQFTQEYRQLIESFRSKGLRHAREVNRAHILAALDRDIPESQIMEVLGVGRTLIWRTRAAYLEEGLDTPCTTRRNRANHASTSLPLKRRLRPWPVPLRRRAPQTLDTGFCWSRRRRRV